MRVVNRFTVLALSAGLAALPAAAQSFRVQCPDTTPLHPNGSTVDPAHPGQVKCQHIGGGDGFATMADGTQIYLFAFSPLSGLADIEAGLPGTQTAADFNVPLRGPQLLHGEAGAGGSGNALPTGLPHCAAQRRHAQQRRHHRARRDHGHGRAGRQRAGAADGHRRGRRVLPHPQQPRHDHAAGPVRAAHRPLPRLPERLVVLRRRPGRVDRHQHRRQLHLLLHGAGRRDLLLALPHHAARAPADGHGRAALRAPAAEPPDRRRRPRATRWSPANKKAAGRSAARPAASRALLRHPLHRPDAAPPRQPIAGQRRRAASTPTTTATARPATTSSTRSR